MPSASADCYEVQCLVRETCSHSSRCEVTAGWDTGRDRRISSDTMRSEGNTMRALFGLFGSLLLLACLVGPAEADGMRPTNGGRGSSMFAATPPPLRFQVPMIGHGRPFIPDRIVRGQALTRHFIIMNPGPVPPLTGTIVPPFSVGDAVHDRRFMREHRFAFVVFPGHHHLDRFHRFQGAFTTAPFSMLETELPDQVEILGDADEAGTSVAEANLPDAPARPAEPTWRSGQPVLTGTLEEPRVIVVNPARESQNVRIFTPSTGPAPQIVEVPAQ